MPLKTIPPQLLSVRVTRKISQQGWKTATTKIYRDVMTGSGKTENKCLWHWCHRCSTKSKSLKNHTSRSTPKFAVWLTGLFLIPSLPKIMKELVGKHLTILCDSKERADLNRQIQQNHPAPSKNEMQTYKKIHKLGQLGYPLRAVFWCNWLLE